MIDSNVVNERIRQLQAERPQVVERLRQLTEEIERTRHTLTGYDAAIGELSALLATPPQATEAQEESAE